MFCKTVFSGMVFLYAARLAAAATPPSDEAIRQRADSFVKDSTGLAVAIGVVDGDKEFTVCVGRKSFGGPPPDDHTLFEIGSLTKTFTGLLLADAVIRKELKLDQPVAELLGSDAVAPRFGDQPIRLVDLATQTSGLPRLPTNLGIFPNPLNPYANYQEDDLVKFIAGYKLKQAPGEKYNYSNVGMGFLGYALAKHAGTSYEELVKQRICTPLGMDDTTITLSDDQKSRLASGSSGLGLPMMNWDIPGIPGCGAIRATLHDLLIYLRANLHPDSTPLTQAIALAHEPRFTIHKFDSPPATLEIGLAWHVSKRENYECIWHDGMTGGYSCFLAILPARQWGVVVLANRATDDVDELGTNLIKDKLAAEAATMPAK